MKITKDKDDKFIIDFEGLEIDVSEIGVDVGAMNFVSHLFDDEVFSGVYNGVWLFDKSSPAPIGASQRP